MGDTHPSGERAPGRAPERSRTRVPGGPSTVPVTIALSAPWPW
ncbi:hypothetical protein AB0D99_09965 [Streptomyces sp. NPDC047971]